MNKRKKHVNSSWRLDETYIKVAGKDRYLYRAVDKLGDTIDFLLAKKIMKGFTQKFLNKAIDNNAKPRIINIDKNGANTAGIRTWNKRSFTKKKIKIRRVKYLNNIVEQGHWSIKRRLKISLGFKEFESAQRTLVGIKIVNMIRNDPKFTIFKTFCSLAN